MKIALIKDKISEIYIYQSFGHSMPEDRLKKRHASGRRFTIRHSGELTAGEVIVRLLKLAAGEGGQLAAGSQEGGRWRRDGTACGNQQSGGICQDKQG